MPEPSPSADAPELAKANRLKSEFIAHVTHELRTPVHAIIGYADLLSDAVYGQLTDEQAETVAFIRETANDLLSLVNNLLDVSRIESGRTDLVLTSFDIRDLIADVFNQLRPLAESKRLTLRSQVLPAEPVIRTDRGKLKQILVNLVGNAIKFTTSGSITITVKPVAGSEVGFQTQRPHYALAVTDTGCGIPADQLHKLFQKFSQIDSSISRDHEGSGLGLYITKHLVELLAGKIEIVSTVGQGSTLTVALPVNYEELDAIRRLRRCITNQTAPTDTSSDSHRLVLAISDNPNLAKILTDALGAAEYTVKVVPASNAAVATARKLRPLVVLLDADHSAQEFWAVFQELKVDPSTKDIPTIFLGTGDAHQLGSSISVSAPLNHQDILRSIRATTTTGNKKILVVDDDPGFREVLKCALSEDGYQIDEATNGREVIEKLKISHPHLILLDLKMPGLDGWEVIRYLAEHTEFSDSHVLVVTGDTLNATETATLRAHTAGVIRKGEFKVQTVLDQVADVLEVR